MQQQGVGALRVVLVADVQVLQLVQVPGSEGTVAGGLWAPPGAASPAGSWVGGRAPRALPLRPLAIPIPRSWDQGSGELGQLGAPDPSPRGDGGLPGAVLT